MFFECFIIKKGKELAGKMLVSSSSKRSKLYPKARDYCILCISSLIITNFGKLKRYLRPPQKFSWGGGVRTNLGGRRHPLAPP